ARGKFYRGVALVLKKENPAEAERLLKEYAERAPTRSGYPRPAAARAWLGRLFEDQNKMEQAAKEFESALKLDPKNKMAQESLKRLKKRGEFYPRLPEHSSQKATIDIRET